MANSSQPETGYLANKSRIRTNDLLVAKQKGEKWVMLTSYDATSAKIFDAAQIPCVLIGDSAAQLVYGYKTTLPITMDELIPLARAVANSCSRALVVADIPFGSYQEGPQQALRNAVRLMKEAQVHCVKLEGGRELSEHVKLLTQSGIPVMGHVGFTPQREHTLGGYKVQGRSEPGASSILDDAVALESAGAFACVLEMVPNYVGAEVTRKLRVPTIGIGAGPSCDAQVLVWTDMAGFIAPRGTDASGPQTGYLIESALSARDCPAGEPILQLGRVPKFVKQYANMSETLFKAARQFAEDVKLGAYPDERHCYDR